MKKTLMNAVCLQLVLAPVSSAYAISVGEIAQTFTGALQQTIGPGGLTGNSYQDNANQELMKLGEESVGKLQDNFFTYDKLKKLPGFEAFIASTNQQAAMGNGTPIDASLLSCASLNTQVSDMDRDVCKKGKISNFSPLTQDLQAKEAYAYYEKYKAIEFAYKGYSKDSHEEGQAFGVGCQNKALTIIEAYLASQLKDITDASDDLDKAIANFKQVSETDLNAIKESTALLDGQKSKFYNDYKDSNLFDFASRFQGEACNSIMAPETLNADGIAKGLNGISTDLTDKFTKPAQGNQYSAQQYFQNSKKIEEDIQSMAKKVSQQAKVNFSSYSTNSKGYADFLGSLQRNVGTNTGVNNLLKPSAFADLQASFNESMQKLADRTSDLSAAGVGNDLLAQLNNVNSNKEFNAKLTQFRDSRITSCITGHSRYKDFLNKKSIFSAGLSSSASDVQVEKLITDINQIMSEPGTSEEDKLAKVQSISSKFQVRLPADYVYSSNSSGTVQTVTRKAAAGITASNFYADIIKECKTKFDVQTISGSSLTGKTAYENLKSLKNDYQKLATKHAEDIEKEITKKFRDCNNDAKVQNSNTVGSCSTSNFNMNSDSFCAKGAESCASNMKKCSEHATQIVKDMKSDRKVRSNNFNKEVKRTEAQLTNIIENINKLYKDRSKEFLKLSGVALDTPMLARDNKPSYLSDFQGGQGESLNLLDIDKSMNQAKANLVLIKKSVENQHKAFLDTLKNHIKKTGDNYKNAIVDVKEKISGCYGAYASYEEFQAETQRLAAEQEKEKQKLQSEMGEKTAELCNAYSSAMSSNPNSVCEGDINTIITESLKASQKTGQPQLASEIYGMRDQINDMCGKVNNYKEASFICQELPPAPKDNNTIDPYKQTREYCYANEYLGGEAEITEAKERLINSKICSNELKEKDIGSSLRKTYDDDGWKCDTEVNKQTGKISCSKSVITCSDLDKKIVSSFGPNAMNLIRSKKSNEDFAPSLCAAANNSKGSKEQGSMFQQILQAGQQAITR